MEATQTLDPNRLCCCNVFIPPLGRTFMPVADSDGVAIEYQVRGPETGETVVFISGLGYGQWFWDWQVPAFEDAIADHSKVNEVVVVPVPDDEWGEVGKAVVEGDESLTLEELDEFLDQKIARFKIPQYLEFTDEMPMSGPSKIDRQTVKEQYGDGLDIG